MGKYTKLKENMVKFAQPPDFQQKVDLCKKELVAKKTSEITTFYDETMQAKQDAEMVIKECNVRLEAVNQVLVERLEDDDTSSVKINGNTYYIQDKPYSSVQDKGKLLAWVRETGQEDLLALNYNTLAAIVNANLIEGKEIPPGVAVFMKSTIQRREGK